MGHPPINIVGSLLYKESNLLINQMTTRRNQAELRVRQTMTIDFFQIADDAGGPTAFADALELIFQARPNARSRDVQGQPLTFYEISSSEDYIEGEIGRLRDKGAPFLGTRTGERVPVPLRNDQFIAECTAFLFDRETGVLAIHTTMEGVSASRLSGFCDATANRPDKAEFTLLPVIRTDTQRNLRAMTSFKKVEVRLATPQQGRPVEADISTRSFVRGARHLGGDKVLITVVTERGYPNELEEQATRDLIRTARANDADRLLVTGRGAGDRSMTLDLINDRLREKRIVDVRGRSASYEMRSQEVRTAFERNIGTFRALERDE